MRGRCAKHHVPSNSDSRSLQNWSRKSHGLLRHIRVPNNTIKNHGSPQNWSRKSYATSSQKIWRCSNSRGFHFFILFPKKSSKVLKTCSKTGILNVCMLKPNAIIGGSFWRSFQIHKNQVLKNTVDRRPCSTYVSHLQKSIIIRTTHNARTKSTLCARTTRRFAQ